MLKFTQEEHESFLMAEELEYIFSGQNDMIEIQDWWKDLQGMPFDEAKKLAESKGWKIRAKVIDGKPMMVTADMRRDRINVSLTNGKVGVFPYSVG